MGWKIWTILGSGQIPTHPSIKRSFTQLSDIRGSRHWNSVSEDPSALLLQSTAINRKWYEIAFRFTFPTLTMSILGLSFHDFFFFFPPWNFLKAQSVKRISSPVPEAWYPTLALLMLSVGLILTASFFMWDIDLMFLS